MQLECNAITDLSLRIPAQDYKNDTSTAIRSNTS
jgi:hypothetical protein